jgi:hypothetical protein
VKEVPLFLISYDDPDMVRLPAYVEEDEVTDFRICYAHMRHAGFVVFDQARNIVIVFAVKKLRNDDAELFPEH